MNRILYYNTKLWCTLIKMLSQYTLNLFPVLFITNLKMFSNIAWSGLRTVNEFKTKIKINQAATTTIKRKTQTFKLFQINYLGNGNTKKWIKQGKIGMEYLLKKPSAGQLKSIKDRKSKEILEWEFFVFVWIAFCLGTFQKNKLGK